MRSDAGDHFCRPKSSCSTSPQAQRAPSPACGGGLGWGRAEHNAGDLTTRRVVRRRLVIVLNFQHCHPRPCSMLLIRMTATLCGPAATVRRAGVRTRTFQGTRFLPSEVYQTQRPAPRCPAASFCALRVIFVRSHQCGVSARVALTPTLSRKREREPAASRGDAGDHFSRRQSSCSTSLQAQSAPSPACGGGLGWGMSRALRRRCRRTTSDTPNTRTSIGRSARSASPRRRSRRCGSVRLRGRRPRRNAGSNRVRRRSGGGRAATSRRP
ncbi:hypothetical protein SAMN05444123_101576 [Rhodopseudomonas pseudopalustris]|uniref:Uncharacterized protein n=1 Tax=Rhodopseudomonas pseudopalustris TaxID=1513892 RepID=A0A1H8MKN9_9BRAD|nr:hypothetical protein SAMN05444123_101576 [Rhodopseudomonas pseudopalustris]